MLSFELTNDLNNRIRKVNNLCIDLYSDVKSLNEDELRAIAKYARISTIGASTRIENALLTNPEIDWIDTILTKDGKTTAFNQHKNLIEDKLSKDRERSIEEVAGCRNMLLSVINNHESLKPLRETDIRSLHAELMTPFLKSSPYIGNYKTQSNVVVETNKVTGSIREVFKTADAGVMTQIGMRYLVDWYNDAISQEAWSIPVVCEFVYRFLAIHPFQDGNGRLSRGLFMLGMFQSRDVALSSIAPLISIDRQIEKHKEEYYFVLNSCSQGNYSEDPSQYKIEYFLRFILKMIEKSISDIGIYRKKYHATLDLSQSAVDILKCFKEYPELRLTTKIIINHTDLPRRTVVHNLNILIDNNLIQRFGKGAGVRYQLTF